MRTISASLAVLFIATTASNVSAQTTDATANATAPTTAASVTKPSVDKTSIGDLVADPKTKAVLAKDYPGLLSYGGLDDIKGMTLSQISKFPQADLDAAKLAAIQKDFDAIPAS
jgi:hypothetical protein